MIRKSLAFLLSVAVCALSSAAYGASTTVVGFDGGSDGGFTGNAFFETMGGNPGGNAHHSTAIFFNEIRTGGVGEPANANFLGDYSSFGQVTFSFDVKTDSLTDFLGNPILRSVGFRISNRNIQGPDGDSGVFFEADKFLGTNPNIGTPDWTTLSVTIDDPTSATLPTGWIGFGDTNALFEPVLPAGVTFADILANATDFAITGAVPGFFFTDAFFDVRIDNVAVTVPEPGSCVFVLTGFLALVFRRR